MSRGSSSSPSNSWPRYGQVPLTRCPECLRSEPLVRLTCKKMDTGNYDREFVKCESRPQPGQILKHCNYFMWMDAYVEKMKLEGMLKLNGSPQDTMDSKIDFRRAEGANGGRVVDFGVELKNLNAKISQIVDLKKQEIVMAGAFYICVFVLFIGLIVVMKH